MYYQGEIEKKDRRKVIMIATAIVAVVLVLIVAIIVVATRKSSTAGNVGGNENASFAIDETAKKDEAKEETEEESKESTEVVAVTPAEPTTSVAPSNIPTTGPEDILPTALALGALTTAGTAYALSFTSKRKA